MMNSTCFSNNGKRGTLLTAVKWDSGMKCDKICKIYKYGKFIKKNTSDQFLEKHFCEFVAISHIFTVDGRQNSVMTLVVFI